VQLLGHTFVVARPESRDGGSSGRRAPAHDHDDDDDGDFGEEKQRLLEMLSVRQRTQQELLAVVQAVHAHQQQRRTPRAPPRPQHEPAAAGVAPVTAAPSAGKFRVDRRASTLWHRAQERVLAGTASSESSTGSSAHDSLARSSSARAAWASTWGCVRDLAQQLGLSKKEVVTALTADDSAAEQHTA
jgi:hypothetical protein